MNLLVLTLVRGGETMITHNLQKLCTFVLLAFPPLVVDCPRRSLPVLLELPAVFQSAHPNILTPKLRSTAEQIILTVLSWQVAQIEGNSCSIEFVESLLKFSPDCTQGRLIAVELYQSVGRFDDAVTLLKELIEGAESGKQRTAYEQQLVTLEGKMSHISGQLGETELLCPICLSDCINPQRPNECPHLACKKCWMSYFGDKKRMPCPLCRKSVSKETRYCEEIYIPYYLGRLDRNIDDYLAWYNVSIAFYDDENKHGVEHSKAYQLFREQKPVLPGNRTSLGLFFAAEGLKRNCAGVEKGNFWCCFTTRFHANTSSLPIPTRQSLQYDLGPKLGKVTLLDAATELVKHDEVRIDVFLSVVCRDYSEEIANNTFTTNFRGKELTAYELCRYAIEHFKAPIFSSIVVQMVYILAVTDSLSKDLVYVFREASAGTLLRFTTPQLFSAGLTANMPLLKRGDGILLAIAWRNLSSPSKKKLKFSQRSLWGFVVQASQTTQQVEAVANAMLPGECAIVVGGLLERDDVIAYFQQRAKQEEEE